MNVTKERYKLNEYLIKSNSIADVIIFVSQWLKISIRRGINKENYIHHLGATKIFN